MGNQIEDEINTPYSWEINFYKRNHIPLWECETHKEKDLGIIYKTEEGSFIKAKVNCLPAQFFEFEIYDSEGKITYKISTGSGGLSNYFNAAKLLADGMFVIKDLQVCKITEH